MEYAGEWVLANDHCQYLVVEQRQGGELRSWLAT
jgi:hypothetical protein